MSDIGRVLNTSKDALLSHLTAINITGSNIANVNTPGYSRLRPVFSSLGVSGSGTSEIQLGVQVIDAERIYDQYLNAQLVQQSQETGYGEAQKNSLERVEGIFNESGGGGLSEALTNFWNAWEDLANNPSGLVERDALVSVSSNLSDIFRQKASQLNDVQKDVNGSISDTVSEINSMISDIAQYNDKIVQILNGGGNASDLLDKRQESLETLGDLIGFDHMEAASGGVTVYLSNGKPLVQDNTIWELDVVVNPDNSNFYDVVFKETGEVLNGVITKGKLGAYLDVRDTNVKGYLDKLDALAENLVNAVNGQHQTGYDAYGNMGGNFFNPATEAADMQVSAAVAADSQKVAASGSVTKDGNNAIEIAGIKDSLLMEGGTSTLSGYYSSLLAGVGQDVRDANGYVDRHMVIMNQLKSQQEAVSGVSLDEEMMNLIKFQMGYSAAGKLCNTVNEMMNTLLDLAQ